MGMEVIMKTHDSGGRQRKPRRIRKILLLAVLAVVALNVILLLTGTVLEATVFEKQLRSLRPYGRLVETENGRIHLTAAGNGEKTVVILPGLGVALPCAEFGPLMRVLSESYTAVTVEYFGTGFSDGTDSPRTSRNYVEEVRNALSAGGYPPPYILMPHSISGVYAEAWASLYPREVEALISLDGTSTAYAAEVPKNMKALLGFGLIQQKTGLTSLVGRLTVNRSLLESLGYTEKEIGDLVVFSGFTLTPTVINQIASTGDCILQTRELPFPPSVPCLKIISRKTLETPNPQINISPREYQKEHLKRLGPSAGWTVLEGDHFIYRNNAGRIKELTDTFLKDPAGREFFSESL